MNKINFCISILFFILFGCNRSSSVQSKLYGTWSSDAVESEWGRVVFYFTFRDNNRYSCTVRDAVSPSDTTTAEGFYCINGGALVFSPSKLNNMKVKGDLLDTGEILLRFDNPGNVETLLLRQTKIGPGGDSNNE